MNTQRLTPETWINAGLSALQGRGAKALGAEPLARQLGTTKGSFYWHFKDVPAFHKAILRHWKAAALGEVIDLLRSDGSTDARLRQFGHNVLSDTTEPALRVWAHTDAEVAKALSEVDEERLKYISHLLRQLGLRNPDFARAVLACLIGLPQVPTERPTGAAFDTLVDTVLALA